MLAAHPGHGLNRDHVEEAGADRDDHGIRDHNRLFDQIHTRGRRIDEQPLVFHGGDHAYVAWDVFDVLGKERRLRLAPQLPPLRERPLVEVQVHHCYLRRLLSGPDGKRRYDRALA